MHTLAHARGAHSLFGPGCVATFMAGKFSGGRGSRNGMIFHSNPSFQERDWLLPSEKRGLPWVASWNMECVLSKGSGMLQWHKDTTSSGFPDQGSSTVRGLETSHRHCMAGPLLGAWEHPTRPRTDEGIRKCSKHIRQNVTEPWRKRQSCQRKHVGEPGGQEAQRREQTRKDKSCAICLTG